MKEILKRKRTKNIWKVGSEIEWGFVLTFLLSYFTPIKRNKVICILRRYAHHLQCDLYKFWHREFSNAIFKYKYMCDTKQSKEEEKRSVELQHTYFTHQHINTHIQLWKYQRNWIIVKWMWHRKQNVGSARGKVLEKWWQMLPMS